MSAYETEASKAARLERERAERKKARETPFNGYTNIGTWRVALVLGNDESAYRWVLLRIFQIANSGAEGEKLEKRLASVLCYRVRRGEVPFDASEAGIMASELRLALREGGINWREIARSFIDEDESTESAAGDYARVDGALEGAEVFEWERLHPDFDAPRDPMDDSDEGNDAMDAYYDRLVD